MGPVFTCPRCHGDKQLFAFINRGEDVSTHEAGMIDCDFCGAYGFVSEEKLRAFAAGKDMRADRLKRGKSLSEEAARLKLTPAQYSALENGRAMPPIQPEAK